LTWDLKTAFCPNYYYDSADGPELLDVLEFLQMKNQRIRIDTNQNTTFNDFEAKKTDYTQL
jgi:hypothetical protein